MPGRPGMGLRIFRIIDFQAQYAPTRSAGRRRRPGGPGPVRGDCACRTSNALHGCNAFKDLFNLSMIYLIQFEHVARAWFETEARAGGAGRGPEGPRGRAAGRPLARPGGGRGGVRNFRASAGRAWRP